MNIDNSTSNRFVTGSADNDSIDNWAANVTIDGGAGNDTVWNHRGADQTSILGGAGADSIHNFASFVTLLGGDGNDTIGNYSGRSSKLDGGAGNDRIINAKAGDTTVTATNTTIDGGSGNDSIYNGNDSVTISGGTGNDTITNTAASVKVDAGAGNDSISNYGKNVTINAGTGNDRILSHTEGENTTIFADAGSDTVTNWSHNIKIDGGEGNDYIDNRGRNTTIDGGAGNDSISNSTNSENTSILGGAGRDTITENGTRSTIYGGADDDIISLVSGSKNALIVYNLGEGNDTVYGFNSNSTLKLGDGTESYFSQTSGSDILVSVEGGTINLRGAATLSGINIDGVTERTLNTLNTASNVSIISGNYADSIRNRGSNVRIISQGGNDSIENRERNTTIDAGEGDDSITNRGDNVMILAKGGNDTIDNYGRYTTIDSGAEESVVWRRVKLKNDIIDNKGAQVSINASAGNDSINNSGSQVTIDGGDDDDTILSSGSNVTIECSKGNDYIENSGANVLFQYANGDGNLTIRGFSANSTLLISGGGGVKTFNNDSNGNVYVTVGGSVITLQDASTLPTVNIVENPVNIHNSDRSKFISGTNVNDTIINSGEGATVEALGGKDSISNNAAWVSINGGAGNDNISNNGKKVTVNGGEDNDTIYNNAANDNIDGGWGNDYIFNHGEVAYIKGGDGYYGGRDTIENYTNSDRTNIWGLVGNDSIKNRSSMVMINGGDDRDTILSSGTANKIYGGSGGDRIILESSYKNTIWGGKGNDTIQLDSSSNNTLIQYNKSYSSHDGNDLIEGFNTTSTLRLGNNGELTYSRTDSGDDVIIQVEKGGNITLKGAAQLAKLNIEGVTKLNVNNTRNSVEILGDRLDDNIVNDGKLVTVSTNAGKDTVSNSGSQVSIDGGADSDSISNSGSQVSIDGGENNDSISNSGRYDTILGGDGDDRISLGDGYRNVISGGAGSDSIYISPTEKEVLIKHSEGDGNDYINGFNETSTLQIGDGTATFSRELHYSNDVLDYIVITSGEDKITLDGEESLLSDISIFGVGDGKQVENTTHNTVISGTANNDTIINSDASFVTINGGKGNDTLENRNGRDITFVYNAGDGNDLIEGFNSTSKLSIASGEFTSETSGSDIIVTVGEEKITLRGAADLSKANIVTEQTETTRSSSVNADDDVSVVGTPQDDDISNSGSFVTINALGGDDTVSNNGSDVIITAGEGDDSISNNGFNGTIEAGAGNDAIVNEYGFYSSISGGEGNDFITVSGSAQVTVNAGEGNDVINLKDNEETFINYMAGDGNDIIQGFDENATLNIGKSEFTSTTNGNDIVLTVGSDKITLSGAATLSNPNITNGTYATFTIKNSNVTCETDLPDSVIKNSYELKSSQLKIDDKLKNYLVTVKNEDDSVKANWNSGTATLKSGSTLKYRLADENNVTLTSKNYGDEISLAENVTFNYGRLEAEILKSSSITTKGNNAVSFGNNSSANVTAPRGYQIEVAESNITINDMPINALNGAGTVTVERRGLSFEGYGVQFADLQVAPESYFGKLAPMTVSYNSSDESYKISNTSCVKTLSDDFIKLTLDFSGKNDDDKYAYYKVNDVAFLIANDEDNLNVVDTNGNSFKIQDKEINAEKIGRVTIDEQITFSGTEINFDGVKTNYAQNKPVIYSLDGKEISISDTATVTTSSDTKTFKCEAGTYIVNGKSFETSADLTFTADTKQIKIPLNAAQSEIYFDGVKVSGVADGGEIVFDLANNKISIPTGATLNVTSPDETKLNLAAGSFTIDDKNISSDNALEITVDKNDLKVPLSENAVTINGAAITGTGTATIDNTDELLFSILLPNGATVKNTSDNIFSLEGKNSAAYFGDTNKKVKLTADGTAYIGFNKENAIGVGFNALLFEQAEILGNDAWTVETAGTSGIDKITGIKGGATISTSTEYIDAGDLRFEVETNGAGDFTICGEKFTSSGGKNTYVVRGNSNDEIKVSRQDEEYSGDNSEAAGKTYQFDAAGDYTVNGVTFHAEENSKAQTITRGVEFDLSTGAFQYDGLTLEGGGTAQINRYNARLISLTDGAQVNGSDESKYSNRQFEINGTVEIIGKKFETNRQIRCALLNIQEAIEGISTPLIGFVVDDKYVAIQDDCYDGVKVVDKKISSIEGVNDSAKISGNGLSKVSIVTTDSGEFTVQGKTYKISGDSDGVTFVTDSHGNVAEINGLEGSVEGNFENEISVNGKAIQLTGASTIKVTSDGENITEISDVSGDSVTTDGKTYRKDVRVYELGGAEKLTTSADGTIIFSGNKFETSAGKTFNLDTSGNISEIEKTQGDTATSFDSDEENFDTINLTTTDGLEEVFGDFSEGLSVNGVFVRVTDSTNFVVKDDDENIYVEATAPDTFTINGKTFETYADKTLFKLDAQGNVCEIVSDKFYLYPDEDAYLIEGDFSDEIIFNGKKFCVTGTNDTNIFLDDDETLIGIELARNSVEVVESGGAAEIALSGAGDITIGDKTFSTSDDFIGVLQMNSGGEVYAIEDFIGTISGSLGGLELAGLTITTEDSFSVTGDGEKITAIENLQNGSLTSGDLDSITINGESVSFDDSEEVTLTVTDGKLKNSADNANGIAAEILNSEEAVVVSGNLTLGGGSVAIVEDTSAKVSLTASKGHDTIYTAGKHVNIDLKSGGATEIFAAEGRVTVENYDAKTGAAFLTENENIAEAIEENSIAYDDGRLTVNSALVTFADNADSKVINFVDVAGDLQNVGFASDDSELDAGKETGSLILVGGMNSTITGGNGRNQIYLDENSESTILLNGRNTIENFTAGFDGGDKVLIDPNSTFNSFDGENLKITSGNARATLQNISSGEAFVEILETDKSGEVYKTAIAQAGAVITIGDELADIYVGKKSGVDFTSFDESLTIDLSKNFYGINQITVGGGLNTLIGSSSNETLTGNANGITEFVFNAGGGRDVIRNFNFEEDKINVGSNVITNVVLSKSGGVRLEMGEDRLTIEDAQGKNFRINEFTAKVDTNLEYDDEANYYVASSRNATLTVADEAEIWLDGSYGKYFVGDIKTLDATNSDGRNILAGNSLDNTILAGDGNASLWGGNGGDDLIVGGEGQNMFFYSAGNGSDTIQGANDDDAVILSNISLEQIIGSKISANAVDINFTDGGALHVEGNSAVKYQLVDGSTYEADHEQATWTQI